MRRPLACAGALAGLLLGAAPVGAGPWSLARGRSYVKATYTDLRTTTYANPDGSEVEIPRFVKQSLTLYGAAGLGHGLMGYASVPFWRSSDLEGFDSAAGFGDLQLGLQWQLPRRGPWVLAVRGTLQAPTGDENAGEGVLPTGSGVWEGWLLAGAGRSLAGGKAYVFLEVGPQVRQTLRDGFAYGGQIGWNATRRLVLAFGVDGLQPWSTVPREEALGSPVGLGDGVAYLSFGPTVIVALGGGLALQADVVGGAFTRNLAVGTEFRVGLSFSR